MKKRTLVLAAAALVLNGCLDDPVAPTSNCKEVEIPALAGDTVRTSSGLKYIVRSEGTGTIAEARNTVTVHYTGYLPDGTLFDTSRDGEPASFSLGEVIPGFAEGITGMHVGGSRRLILPPSLAYGSGSPSPCIPANSTLIFDVELLGVE